MSDAASDDRKDGSEVPSTAKPWYFNAGSARAAARKSAEARKKKGLAKLAPEQLAERAMEDLAFVREQSLAALKGGKLGARERCDLLKLTASIADTLLDRTQGKPRPGREPGRWSPEEYAEAAARYEAEGRGYAARIAAEGAEEDAQDDGERETEAG